MSEHEPGPSDSVGDRGGVPSGDALFEGGIERQLGCWAGPSAHIVGINDVFYLVLMGSRLLFAQGAVVLCAFCKCFPLEGELFF